MGGLLSTYFPIFSRQAKSWTCGVCTWDPERAIHLTIARWLPKTLSVSNYGVIITVMEHAPMSSLKDDPLASLISSDARATDRRKLAELLAPYIVIDQDSREFGFLPALHEIGGNENKLEVLLAGAKARALYFGVADGLGPADIVASGLMPPGSVKSGLKRLFDSHKIKKDKDGRYILPTHRIADLIKKLGGQSS
ncbi:MAG: hypothetical protein KGL11_15025 [Alphaproteobacteria bacterium]|nr:hypothetical protein [Alphaproteobacteria bacterium]